MPLVEGHSVAKVLDLVHPIPLLLQLQLRSGLVQQRLQRRFHTRLVAPVHTFQIDEVAGDEHAHVQLGRHAIHREVLHGLQARDSRLLSRPRDRRDEDGHRLGRDEGLEAERRDDPHRTARTPDGPEEVRVLGLRDVDHGGIGEDDSSLGHPVEGQALGVRVHAVAAVKCVTSDADTMDCAHSIRNKIQNKNPNGKPTTFLILQSFSSTVELTPDTSHG